MSIFASLIVSIALMPRFELVWEGSSTDSESSVNYLPRHSLGGKVFNKSLAVKVVNRLV